MFILKPTNQFKKDLKTLKKRSAKDLLLITEFLLLLEENGASGIPKQYKLHKLTGNYKDNWEAHIKPDLLIIWFEINENSEVILLRVGSHADLF